MGDMTQDCVAQLQKCKPACGLCKGANVGDISGSQVSAFRSQVQVISYRYGCGKIQVLNLHPNLKTRTRLPIAETRDLKVFSYPNPYPNPNPSRITFALLHRGSAPICTFALSLSSYPSGPLVLQSHALLPL